MPVEHAHASFDNQLPNLERLGDASANAVRCRQQHEAGQRQPVDG